MKKVWVMEVWVIWIWKQSRKTPGRDLRSERVDGVTYLTLRLNSHLIQSNLYLNSVQHHPVVSGQLSKSWIRFPWSQLFSPLLSSDGHPLQSPNGLLVLFSTCIKWSLIADPLKQTKNNPLSKFYHVFLPKSKKVVFFGKIL